MDKKDKLDYKNLNEVIGLSNKLLKLVFVFFILSAIYITIIVGKEIGVWEFLKGILKVISPLFVGIIIAWLFNPLVTKLEKKGIRRGIGSLIAYLIFIGLIILMFAAIIPMLFEQLTELSNTMPAIITKIQIWISDLFDSLNKIEILNAQDIKQKLFNNIEKLGSNIATNLPDTLITSVKSLISGTGTFVIGLIIGFYLLLSYDNIIDSIVDILPKRLQKSGTKLGSSINISLRKYVRGALIDCTLVFVLCSIGFWLIGLKSPLLFGLFVGITNIIPYLGPYIGGAPAVIVGLSQNPIIGIFSIIIMVVIQFVEGNFLQPIIMSKAIKLHPIVIMLGLLIFGYFFGIIGMIFATPIIAVIKTILDYFDEKYDIFKFE